VGEDACTVPTFPQQLTIDGMTLDAWDIARDARAFFPKVDIETKTTAARMPMIAITTKSSTRVNPRTNKLRLLLNFLHA
jgi:hypothetical protein